MTWHQSPLVGVAPVVQYGQTLENTAAMFNPELAPYLELEAKVFDIADSIGIGDQVRILYYALASGQRTGAVLTTVVQSAPIISGSAVATLAGAISSIASMVGIVLGVISLFGDDGESKAAARLVARVAKVLEWQSIDDLIAEQHELSQTTNIDIDALVKEINKSGTTIDQVVARIQAAQAGAQKLEQLLTTIKQRLSPDELALFVAVSNLGRWEQYLLGWNAMGQDKRDIVRKYIDLGHLLDLRIAEASTQVKAISATLAQKNIKLVRYYPEGASPEGATVKTLEGIALLGGVAAIALAIANPPLAAAMLAGAKSHALGVLGWVKRVPSLARNLVHKVV